MAHAFKQRIYEFGDFRIDVDHRMLYHQGSEIPVVPKVVETLLALIERRGKIVSKDELLEAVWPDSVVEESNLFVYLSVLRKTLGPLQDGRPYVETLRRRGYRFNGEVHLVEEAVEDKNYELPVDEFEQSRANIQSQAARLHVVKKVIAPIDSFRSATTDSLSVDDLPTDLSVWRQTNPAVTDLPEARRDWPLRRWSFSAVGVIALVTALALGYRYFFNSRSINTRSIDSIAVMPFVNESGDVELEYLSDGMTETLIARLSELPNLKVQARSSVFHYKGKETDARTIGKELNVRAILNGSVVQRGDDLTFYLELVDAQSGSRLWGDQYNRKRRDLVSLQAEIARDVSNKLKIKLSGADERKLAKNYTENVEAYNLFLKGRFYLRKRTEPEIKKGIAFMQQAIDADPSYALAYAGMGEAYRALALAGEMKPSEVWPKAKAANQKAIEIDDTLAEGHSGSGSNLFFYDWSWKEAEIQFQRALALNPNSSMAHFGYGDFLSRMGRKEESVAEKKRAMELEPRDPFFTLAAAFAAEPDKGLELVQDALDVDPNYYFAHMAKAAIYKKKKMYPESISEYQRAKALAPDQTLSDVWLAGTFVETGQRNEARAILNQMLRLSKSRWVPPCHIAMVYRTLGETDKAVAWLEKGYEQRDPGMTSLKTDKRWDYLSGDPRFAALMKRMHFPE